jgi:small subunit ribosomal protein S35
MDLFSQPFADDDTTSAGHLMLQGQRQVLYYLRLIEHEMPKLVGEALYHLALILR